MGTGSVSNCFTSFGDPSSHTGVTLPSLNTSGGVLPYGNLIYNVLLILMEGLAFPG